MVKKTQAPRRNVVDETKPFGRYRLLNLLGRGGMGEVWRAYDTVMDRVIALKLMSPDATVNAIAKQRFRQEARAAAGLDDPHIVPIHDFGEIDGQLFVTMRLVHGCDLNTLLTRGALDPVRAVSIIEQVADGLHAAHQANLVHRDVKPSNILVTRDDFAYLIDFGVASANDRGDTGLTDPGHIVGTWAYMAPERITRGITDRRADIYALACVLHQCLTGQQPYPSETVGQLIAAHVSAPPPRPSILRRGLPTGLDAVIARGLAKEPTQRFATAKELAAAARAAINTPAPGAVGPWAEGLRPVLEEVCTPRTNRPLRAGITAGKRVALAAAAAVVSVVALVLSAQQYGAFAGPENTESALSAGPLTGLYRAEFGPELNLGGDPIAGGEGSRTGTYGLRSACGPDGCVATANVHVGPALRESQVFDDVGGKWVSVSVVPAGAPLSSGFLASCPPGVPDPGDVWETTELEIQPDGTLAGQYTVTSTNLCDTTRSVTFTRVDDIDIDAVADPMVQGARKPSPAEALHGNYRYTRHYLDGRDVSTYELTVETHCLRGGESCISYFHTADGAMEMPLLFERGRWIRKTEFDALCAAGGRYRTTTTGTYPMPDAPQNPVAVLTGVSHQEISGNSACAGSVDIAERFERAGDLSEQIAHNDT